MSDLTLGFVSFPLLLVLIFLRAPIGLAMLAVGAGGLMVLTGGPATVLAMLKSQSFSTFASYNLAAIPMFLLMGNLAALGGMSAALFAAARAVIGHRRGGMAMAAIGACAGFGAICGSSLATAATMGQVALPELRRAGHSGGFAAATLAAGGTLGVLIPPSVVLVVYAILTQQNIAQLFLAAMVPGLLAALFYAGAVALYVRAHPDEGQPTPALPWRARLLALVRIWPVAGLFALVVGGIYGGWFTPVEGAAVGAAGAFVIALAGGGITLARLGAALLETARTSAMIFFILLGAALYNSFLARAQVPQELSSLVAASGLGPWAVLGLILLLYLVLGCLMDSLSMILLTIPIFFPLVMGLDFGLAPDHVAIWFGILVLIVVEVGLITPPVGMNLFVIQALDRTVPISATYGAVLWFVAADMARVALLVAVPAVTLFLL
ncbi:TRAP transporter large permease [Phaeovulum vinaykumarii]|uniref:TRAP transporter large permease protein n=1 Tax=Phaeovulum vinaykumarii TaxID=407234 RepID=A0A1N7KAP3_9RHOB|nr:TRAP transporter large permease [Phaeovulum vinaykumarii]SIS58494.1 TRAP transporter, DctM subunit [Phaeovulum vinaykumarii]SOB93818.1 tripartite ATP-independent transporter DctM subunit [Phaeovulum vinaykumarii]